MVSLSRGGCCRSSCSCHHAEEPIGPSECVLSKATEPAWDSTHSSAGGWRARIVGGGKQRTTRATQVGSRSTCHVWHMRSVRCEYHAWHMRQAGGGACGVRATCGTCSRQVAAPAVCMPRVARAPGRGRSVRRTGHTWHMRQAGGGACGVHATCGTCARQGAERAAYRPRVAHEPGGRRSVRYACHTWHMSQVNK